MPGRTAGRLIASWPETLCVVNIPAFLEMLKSEGLLD
jgi:hypothetical protein